MSRMRDSLLGGPDPPVIADTCELGLGNCAVHENDVVQIAARVEVIRPGTYCFAVGAPSKPGGDGYSSFLEDHYDTAVITGSQGDVVPVRLEFRVDGSLGVAWGVYGDKESVPVLRKGVVRRHLRGIILIGVLGLVSLFLLALCLL